MGNHTCMSLPADPSSNRDRLGCMTTLTPAKLPRSTTPHILTLNQSGAHSLSLTSVYQAVQGKGIVNAHREYVDVDTLEQVTSSASPSSPVVRRSRKRKAVEEPANDSAQPKRCECGYQRHPANSSSSKNATKKINSQSRCF